MKCYIEFLLVINVCLWQPVLFLLQIKAPALAADIVAVLIPTIFRVTFGNSITCVPDHTRPARLKKNCWTLVKIEKAQDRSYLNKLQNAD